MRAGFLTFIRAIPVVLLVVFALDGACNFLLAWVHNDMIRLALGLIAVALIFWGASRDIVRQARLSER